jgi:hypothetical protein
MLIKFTKLILIAVLGSMLSACEDPQVYGSVGVSSWGGSGSYHAGGSRVGGSITIGGRIH